MQSKLFLFIVLCSLLSLPNCERSNGPKETAPGRAPFTLLRGEETGLTFNNQLELTREFNVFNYMYFYNGGGLAAGDFNNDGLVDLYFTANQGANRMYLNQGDLRFREITDSAGVAGLPGWATGASVVDINQDGLLDIYVNQVSGYLMLEGHNQLYVCQGIENGVPIYEEQAAEYGLDFRGFGTQAAFFDYDLDGDLDVYQLNHSLHQNGTFGKRAGKLSEFNEMAGDKLLRNDGGAFTDVTSEAGIYGSVIGYGLGVATADVNGDGWPDIYVGNDFHENDYLYLNNRDGTFREALTEMIQHTSRFSMGVDIADINNDGRREIFSLDMLPEDPHILKASLGEDGFDVFKFKLGFGYNPQFSRNTLQLNNGDGSFSEIAAYAGIEATDWSWAPLFFDFDLDGKRDLFISNGIPRRMNDIDYINFKTNSELKFREEYNDIRDNELGFIDQMPEIKLKNKFYHNSGNLRFDDLSDRVGGGDVSYSSSAVYVDLDNDGDLDVVTNNIDDAPFVYRNEIFSGETNEGAAAGAWLRIKLQGPRSNRDAVGATAVVYAGEQRLVYDNFPTRGYQASVQAPFHLSLGDASLLDSILLVWPDRTYQAIGLDSLNTTRQVRYRAGLPTYDFSNMGRGRPSGIGEVPESGIASLADVTESAGIDFTHVENSFVDFNRESLMPNMASTDGPALAVGDVDGDGLEDFFIGSSKRNRSALYRQLAGGKFERMESEAILLDSVYEDVAATFADLDNDGDLDLAVAAGGNEYFGKQEPRTQRIYWNDGKGNLRKYILPEIYMTASCVLAGDVNGDGLADLFFGGRIVPRFYGSTPESYLLINRGDGTFEDATETWSPELKHAGLVKAGRLGDIDGDGDLDLVIAAEWAPVTIFRNDGGRFTRQAITELRGWWNTVELADVDGDGDLDILAGNTGLNNKLRPSTEEPLEMYVNDFDDNEQPEQILTYYKKGRKIPFASHAELIKQLPSLKKRYLFAQDMAGASLEEIFGEARLDKAEKFTVNSLASYLFLNEERQTFSAVELPGAAQFSSIHAICPIETAPGAVEPAAFLTGGNFKGSNIEMGWYDASFVSSLSADANGQMTAAPLPDVRIGGEVRNISRITVAGKPAYLVARSGDSVRLLRSRLMSTTNLLVN